MKVYEMIRELSQFDPNLEVSITDGLDSKVYEGDFEIVEFTDLGKRVVDIGIGGCDVDEEVTTDGHFSEKVETVYGMIINSSQAEIIEVVDMINENYLSSEVLREITLKLMTKEITPNEAIRMSLMKLELDDLDEILDGFVFV